MEVSGGERVRRRGAELKGAGNRTNMASAKWKHLGWVALITQGDRRHQLAATSGAGIWRGGAAAAAASWCNWDSSRANMPNGCSMRKCNIQPLHIHGCSPTERRELPPSTPGLDANSSTRRVKL